jgi:hypothetical protein
MSRSSKAPILITDTELETPGRSDTRPGDLQQEARLTRQFLLAARDPSATTDDVHAAAREVLAAVPGSSIIKAVNPQTRIAVVAIPAGLETAARNAAGPAFILEPNADLEPLGPPSRPGGGK